MGGGEEVADGAADVDAADGHLELHLLGVGEVDVGLGGVVAHDDALDGDVAADGVEELLVGVPGRAAAVADDEAVVGEAYVAVEEHVAVAQVDDEAVVLVMDIGVAVVCHAAVGAEYDDGAWQAAVVEHHLVVAGACVLVLV